jgi:DNA polymerase-3 subunit epsilon
MNVAFHPINTFMKELQGRISSTILSGLKGQQNPQNVAFIRQLQNEMNSKETMSIPLTELSVVVVDIETTGFYPEKGDEIISIGAIKVVGGKIQGDAIFYSLIHCDKSLSQEIKELTGIVEEDLQVAPSLSTVLINFFEFVEDAPLVAHHASHERAFLQHASWKLYRAPLRHRIIDTSFLSRLLEPASTLVRLEDFCEHYGIAVRDRHHALGDAKLTAKLWEIYLEKMEQLGVTTLKDLYERVSMLR